MSIAIALVEPLYHVNVGHICRLMKNFGLKHIYMVNPRYHKEEAEKYATHGKDILTSAKIISLEQLRRKFDILIGTTAIQATSRLNILRESISPEQTAKVIKDTSSKDFCILLGRESSGLDNKELELCDLVCVIDTKTRYKTLNISHALAILLYEISKTKPAISSKKSKKRINAASQKDIDLLMQYLAKVAYLGNYDEHKRPLLNAAIKKMVARSSPTSKDIMLIVSLFRKSMLAIQRQNQG